MHEAGLMPSRPTQIQRCWRRTAGRRPSWMYIGAVTAGQGGVAVTAGPACASVSCVAVAAYAAVAAPGPCPEGRSGVPRVNGAMLEICGSAWDGAYLPG
jgi:membrane protein YdbS with pleckstrin-like domain